MHVPRLILLLVPSLTWVGFAVAMRRAFRGADQKNPAKTWLTLSAFVCTLLQMVAVVVFRPASGALTWVGLALYLLANVLLWWSLAVHGKARPAFAFVAAAPVSFTSTGPYRLVRHPIYTAYLLAWLAGALLTQQFWLLATVGWMGFFYYRAAAQEEKTFTATAFAAQYRHYRRHTGMFVPSPRLFSGLRLRRLLP